MRPYLVNVIGRPGSSVSSINKVLAELSRAKRAAEHHG